MKAISLNGACTDQGESFLLAWGRVSEVVDVKRFAGVEAPRPARYTKRCWRRQPPLKRTSAPRTFKTGPVRPRWMNLIAGRLKIVKQMALLLERRLYGLKIAELEQRFRADIPAQPLADVVIGSSDVPHAKSSASVDVSERECPCRPAHDDLTYTLVAERIRPEQACFRHR
jgi:hypothetical protein